jgi:hypothetical protein
MRAFRVQLFISSQRIDLALDTLQDQLQLGGEMNGGSVVRALVELPLQLLSEREQRLRMAHMDTSNEVCSRGGRDSRLVSAPCPDTTVNQPAQSLRRAEVLDVLLPLLEQLSALAEEVG